MGVGKREIKTNLSPTELPAGAGTELGKKLRGLTVAKIRTLNAHMANPGNQQNPANLLALQERKDMLEAEVRIEIRECNLRLVE